MLRLCIYNGMSTENGCAVSTLKWGFADVHAAPIRLTFEMTKSIIMFVSSSKQLEYSFEYTTHEGHGRLL